MTMTKEPATRSAERLPHRKLLALILILLGLLPRMLHGQGLPGEGEGWSFPTNLNSWSFADTNTWQSDRGYAPISHTNLAYTFMGNIFGSYSLSLDSTNPAWLRYNVQENDGTTNLSVAAGSVTMWFSPNWASATTNHNGAGPGDWGRLVEIGSYTTNADYGWWSLYFDSGGTNLYFSAQTNSSDGTTVTYLSAPIDWATNEWHNIALTYSATNTALYLDGQLAASGAGLSVFPGPEVQTNGFWIGSASDGLGQARCILDDIYTYDFPLADGDVSALYSYFWSLYGINIFNAEFMIPSAPSEPVVSPVFKAITGQGWLQWAGSASGCTTSSNVWLTNVTCTISGVGTNQGVDCTFNIAGGTIGAAYDVFASAALSPSDAAYGWAWLGQGYGCNIYTMTNLPITGAFLILGTPLDTDMDGITDAYENLVSKTDPNSPDTSGDGMLDGWKVLWGMNALLNNPNQSSLL